MYVHYVLLIRTCCTLVLHITITQPLPLLPRVQLLKHKTVFHPEKCYIMIGCLGGLGRSMSKWMMLRGARKFVFLGRSGLDKAPARRLVEDLESSGARCTVVVRRDVYSMADIRMLKCIVLIA